MLYLVLISYLMHIGLFNCLFLNDNDILGWMFGLFDDLGMELWISSLVGLNMISMDFLLDLILIWCREVEWMKKGKNPNFYNCMNSANVLDIERSNVALDRSNVRVQTRLRQRAVASNVRTLSMNV